MEDFHATDLEFLMKSISAQFKNYNEKINSHKFICEPPFIKIITPTHESTAKNYVLPVKKSNRGRKKKIKEEKKNFKSNISFEMRMDIHRQKKNDSFKQTATACTEHNDCEIIHKPYNIKIFNGGTIVCVGILRRDNADLKYCLEKTRDIIVKYELMRYNNFNFPPILLEKLKVLIEDDFTPINIKSTLENYQFTINRRIDLYKLCDYYSDISRDSIINIDYEMLYKYLANTITEEVYKIDAATLLEGLKLKGRCRRDFVNHRKLSGVLNNLNLQTLYLEFLEIWRSFYDRNRRVIAESLIKHIKFSMLKQFIIFKFIPIKVQCEMFTDDVVENVSFKENKNTLIVKKMMGDCNIGFRIFGTGTINIQGSDNWEIATQARQAIINVFEKNKEITYLPDEIPIINFRDVI